MVTQVVMYPELNLGIIVFTNQQSGAAFNAISRTIQDSYLGVTGYDWVKIMHDRVVPCRPEGSQRDGAVTRPIIAAPINAPRRDLRPPMMMPSKNKTASSLL